MNQRLPGLDILRGLAVFLMILFHLNYSLVYIFGSEILNFSEIFWHAIGRLAAITFILVAGISYAFAELKYGNKIYKKYLGYALILTLFAVIISAGTYFLFPEQFIVFGILHFFALSFLILPYVTQLLQGFSIFVALGIIIYGVYFIPTMEHSYFSALGLHSSSFFSADYYPLFPWFGVLLLGYSVGVFIQTYHLYWVLGFGTSEVNIQAYLKILGKNALLVYLIHQPLIVAVLFFFQIFGIL